MLRFILRSIRYNVSAHFSNLPNFLAAACGMVINNALFFLGMWSMLFAGKEENSSIAFYYFGLNIIILISYGSINFFCGGWSELGQLITNGQFESKLATPRHPLLLVGTHATHPSAFGDLIMGLVGLIIFAYFAPWDMSLRALAGSVIATIGFFSVYVFSGSLAFYVARGSVASQLIQELVLSLSCYPMGKIFNAGWGRIVLLLSPAAAVSLLPIEWIESGRPLYFVLAAAAMIVYLVFSLLLYRSGVKRYQSLSSIGAQH